MDSVKSFQIDHTKLHKGLYISRVDKAGLFSHVTTFDLRMKQPYVDKPLKPPTAHTLEHCLATYLREIRDDVVYVGPMGCMTGFYVIVKGNKTVFDILPSIKKALYKTMRVTSIPGATEQECGNCGFMDLKDARREALEYLELLYAKYGVNYK